MLLGLIHLFSFPFLFIVTCIVLYKRQVKFWWLHALLLTGFCNLLGLAFAVFLYSDNSVGKPARPLSEFYKHFLD